MNQSGDASAQGRRSIRGVAIFAAAYIVLAAVAALSMGNSEFLFYIGVMLLLMGAVWLAHTRINLTRGALWALAVWGLLHMLGGLVPIPDGWPVNGDVRVLYSLWLIPDTLKYDHVVHAYGFGTTTWVCWQGLRSVLARGGMAAAPTFGLLVLAAAGGMGFGALNEVIEFAATLLVPETNVGGYMNTGWDLVANLVGSTVAATLIYLGKGRGSAAPDPLTPG